MNERFSSAFRSGGAAMGARVRAFDWASTPLGPIASWSGSLRVCVDLMLASSFPSCLFWGPDLIAIYNDGYRPLLGQKPEALGQPMRVTWHEAWDGLKPIADKALAGESTFIEDHPLQIDRHGYLETAYFTFCYSPVYDEQGRVVGLLDTVLETTGMAERKRAAADLQASEHRLRELNADLERRVIERTLSRGRTWQLSLELLGVLNGDGVFEASNPAWASILGWSESEVARLDFFDLVHPEDLAVTQAAWDDAMQRGLPALRLENRCRVKGGGWRWLSWVAVPEDGKVYCSARDIQQDKEQQAELSAAQEALRQSQKLEAIGQLTGGVAHDFNNLLTIISSSVELLRKPGLPEDRRQRFTEAISKAVARGAKLTGQLLAFARRQNLTPSVFDAGLNVRAITEMVDTLVGSRIDINVQTPREPCHVDADPSQFDTAIVNMVVNARDAMNGAGRLGIAVGPASAIPAMRSHPAKAGDYVAITISDTGVGIAPGNIERIFEPFYTTKAVGHGTGLGLSQVFGFAKQSGGEVQVHSRLGEGTTFTLYLPRAHPTGAEAGTHVTNPALEEGQGAVVLVVEDNLDVAAAVTAALDELGYETVSAQGAEQALAIVDAQVRPFAAVFSDVVMAGMDGIELARTLKQRQPALPVILSSGYSQVLAQGSDHGFELLPKPYTLDELARVMRRAIHGTSAADAANALGSAARPVLRSLLSEAEAERARLAELASMQVMDTVEETAYDDLTRMAAEICGAPVALLSLLDDERQWFKASVGTLVKETPREFAFCAHAIRDPDHVMVVCDASLDNRFADNPLVTGDPHIRFYAGAPLVTSAGHALGTLCVLSPTARDIDPKQLEMLQFLANQVVQRLEERRKELAGTAAVGKDAAPHHAVTP